MRYTVVAAHLRTVGGVWALPSVATQREVFGSCLLPVRLTCLAWHAGGMSAAASRVATQAVAAPEAPSQTAAVAEAPRELHGFELVRDEFVHEYDSHVRTYRHQRTGVASSRMLDQLLLCQSIRMCQRVGHDGVHTFQAWCMRSHSSLAVAETCANPQVRR